MVAALSAEIGTRAMIPAMAHAVCRYSSSSAISTYFGVTWGV